MLIILSVHLFISLYKFMRWQLRPRYWCSSARLGVEQHDDITCTRRCPLGPDANYQSVQMYVFLCKHVLNNWWTRWCTDALFLSFSDSVWIPSRLRIVRNYRSTWIWRISSQRKSLASAAFRSWRSRWPIELKIFWTLQPVAKSKANNFSYKICIWTIVIMWNSDLIGNFWHWTKWELHLSLLLG